MIKIRDFFKKKVLTFLLGVTITVTPLHGIAESVIESLSPETKASDIYNEELEYFANEKDFITRAEYAMDSCREYIKNEYYEENDKYATYAGLNLSHMDDEVIYGLMDDEILDPDYISAETPATWMLSQSLFIPLLDFYIESDYEMPLENWFANYEDYADFMATMADGFKFLETKYANHCEKCDIDSLEKFCETYEAKCQKALEENDEAAIDRLYAIGFRMHNDVSLPLSTPDSMKTIKSIYDIYRTCSNGKKEPLPSENWTLKKDPEKLNNKEKAVVRVCNAKNRLYNSFEKIKEKLKPIDVKLAGGYTQHQKTSKKH